MIKFLKPHKFLVAFEEFSQLKFSFNHKTLKPFCKPTWTYDFIVQQKYKISALFYFIFWDHGILNRVEITTTNRGWDELKRNKKKTEIKINKHTKASMMVAVCEF